MTMKTQLKTYGMQQKCSKREVYSNTILPQETRKTLNRQPNFTPKERKKEKSLSRVRLFATPWTVADQVPPPLGFSRQEHWSELPFPSPGLPFLVQQITGSPQGQAAPQIPSRGGDFLPPPHTLSRELRKSLPGFSLLRQSILPKDLALHSFCISKTLASSSLPFPLHFSFFKYLLICLSWS